MKKKEVNAKFIYGEHINKGKSLHTIKLEHGIGRRIAEKALLSLGVIPLTKSQLIVRKFPRLQDKIWLEEKYEEGNSIQDIANIVGTNTQVIKTAFKNLNLKARSSSEAKRVKLITNTGLGDINWITKEYIEKQGSVSSISKELGVSDSAVKTSLKKFSIKSRTLQEQQQANMAKVSDIKKISTKIARNLRTRLWHAIKNGQKQGSAIKDLGCTVEDLLSKMANRFYPNKDTGEMMTWDNYGEWHIDHIDSLSSFDLTDPKQFKKAVHYTNLQPMWAKENWQKNSKSGTRGTLFAHDVDFPKVDLYIISGMCGSGKSWVCEQLTDKFHYVPYDKIPKEQHLWNMSNAAKKNKPILYDPLRKSTTIANRYKEIFNVKFIVINESASTIKTRLISRGGSVADDFDKYYNKFVRYAENATFSGSSDEVLAYLRSILV